MGANLSRYMGVNVCNKRKMELNELWIFQRIVTLAKTEDRK